LIITVESINLAPTANAGEDQTFVISYNESNITVTLNGEDSYDLDGDDLTYMWNLISIDGEIVGNTGDPLSWEMITEVVLEPAIYVFLLNVMDIYLAIDEDFVTKTVTQEAEPENQAPTANAGEDQDFTLEYPYTPIEVTFDGSNSFDPDGTIES